MNNVSDGLDRLKSFFSNEKLTDEEKEERSIEREVKRFEKISSVCTNANDLINSKDFLKGLSFILKITRIYDTNYIYSIFKKLGKGKELSNNEKEDLIKFIQDSKVKEISNSLLGRLESKKNSIKIKVNSTIGKYELFNNFLIKIISKNGFNHVKEAILEVSGIEKTQELQEKVKQEVTKIIIDNEDELEGIKEEDIPEEQFNRLLEELNGSNKPIESIVLESEVVDNTPEGFKEVSITLGRKSLYYKIGHLIDSSLWVHKKIDSDNKKKSEPNIIDIDTYSTQGVLLSPTQGNFQEGEIIQIIDGDFAGVQLFSFNALCSNSESIGARLPTVDELIAIINELGLIYNDNIFTSSYKKDANILTGIGKYAIFATSTPINNDYSNKEDLINCISINKATQEIKVEVVEKKSLALFPLFVKDIE